MSAARSVFFLHIPKTAGTALRGVLENAFAPAQTCQAYHLKEIVQIPAELLASFALVRGHFVHSLKERFPRPPLSITLLREPVARTVSHLKHMRADRGFWMHQFLPLSDMTLEEMIAHPLVRRVLRDYQLRHFALDFDLEYLKTPLMLHAQEEISAAQLEKAKTRLAKYEVVGVAERMEDTVTLLSRVLGVSLPPAERRNTAAEVARGDDVADVSPQVLEEARKLTNQDALFYAYARDCLDNLLKYSNKK